VWEVLQAIVQDLLDDRAAALPSGRPFSLELLSQWAGGPNVRRLLAQGDGDTSRAMTDAEVRVAALREWHEAADRAVAAEDVRGLELLRSRLMRYADEQTLLCRWAVNDLHRIALSAITLIDPDEARIYRGGLHIAVQNLLRKLEGSQVAG
jgi:hypothetical protein